MSRARQQRTEERERREATRIANILIAILALVLAGGAAWWCLR